MPTYQYACVECGKQLEVVQKFTDEALSECPDCTGRLRKVFGAVGVVFKGSGFYRNDSRAGQKAERASSTSDGKSDSKSADSKSSDSKAGAGASSDSASSSSGGSNGKADGGKGGSKEGSSGSSGKSKAESAA